MKIRKRMPDKKIIIAGGGTGGHIFPAIAIANALKKLRTSIDILFVGANGKMEMEKVPQAGYSIKGIDIAGFNRSSLIKNLGLPLKLVKSYFQVRAITADFMPDAVIGVGGYSSFPVLRFAQSKGIPTFIHESNSFAGKTNQLLAKKTIAVFVASDGMEKFFPSDRIVFTGNPVRSAIVESQVSKDDAMHFFKLDASKKTVLVTGGSLGAKGINEAIAAGIDSFGQNNTQLIWQTGKPFAAEAKRLSEGKVNVWTSDFISRMEMAYAAADLVVARAGAMTIAELAVAKKPVVFVPYPFAAEDHQTANAKNLVDKNAALMVRDENVQKDLMATLLGLAADQTQQDMLRNNIGKLAITDADKRIAETVLSHLLNQNNGSSTN